LDPRRGEYFNHARAACFISCAPASSSASPLERVSQRLAVKTGEQRSRPTVWSLAREAAKQKSEKPVAADAVKCVRVRSATRTKEPRGVADAGTVCVREVLPEQRNMGWRTLRNACVSAFKRTLNSHARGWRCRERTAADALKWKCHQPATVTVTLQRGDAGK